MRELMTLVLERHVCHASQFGVILLQQLATNSTAMLQGGLDPAGNISACATLSSIWTAADMCNMQHRNMSR